MLRVVVNYETIGDEAVPFRVFVSLSSDRANEGGYRVSAAVMNQDDLRTQLLMDALNEMRRFAAKYRHLQELAKVVTTIDETEVEVAQQLPMESAQA